jgi:hypothetical protein
MKNDANSSVSNSDTTSPSARATNPAPADVSLSEAEFLKREADRAKAAISQAFSELGQSLKATADPHVLTRDHPWLAISTAAVAGFAAAVTMIPSREQQALRALAELERARHAPPPAPPASPESDKSAAAAGGILGSIAAEALKTIRPLLTTLLSAGISRAVNATSGNPPEGANGHTTEEEISTPS